MPLTIRMATERDLDRLEDIENAADQLFVDRFEPDDWQTAPPGSARAAQPGFLLVAVQDGEPVGFAHVLEADGGTHLEQLAVLPNAGRRGYGGALVRAALAEAERRGHATMTLRTYLDVPWNAPFYACLGFEVSEPGSAFLIALRDAEAGLGLERYGPRVQMTVSTAAEG